MSEQRCSGYHLRVSQKFINFASETLRRVARSMTGDDSMFPIIEIKLCAFLIT